MMGDLLLWFSAFLVISLDWSLVVFLLLCVLLLFLLLFLIDVSVDT